MQARTVPGTGVVISKLNADFLDSLGRCARIPAAQPSGQQQQQQQHEQQQLGHLQPQQQHGSPWHWLMQPSSRSSSSTAAAAGEHTGSPEMRWFGQPSQMTGAAAVVAAAGMKLGLHVAARAMLQAATLQQRFAQAPMPQTAAAEAAAAVAGKKGGDVGAPCLFKFEGKWYLLVAQHSGW
jgi:hypothetical protein